MYKKTFTFRDKIPFLIEDLETVEESGHRYYKIPSQEYFELQPPKSEALYPSITTVLGYFKEEKLKDWRNRVGANEASRITAQASARGTKIHSVIEDYLNNRLAFSNYSPDIMQMFIDMVPSLNRIDNIYHLEQPLYSRRLSVAGRTDCIAEYDGVLSVIDFKSSRKEKREDWIEDYFLQGTAYSHMYYELTGIQINQIVVIIGIDNNAGAQVFVKNPEDYILKLKETLLNFHQLNRKSENVH